VTAWRKLFALNIVGCNEGRQYASYDTIMSIATAALCILGGYIANLGDIYFDMVVSISGCIIMLGGIWSIMIYRHESRKSNLKNS
jgi:flagellar motor component MotA